ncbi:MAG: hypothetical protein RIA64_02560 [Rhodospirillales bacterium]
MSWMKFEMSSEEVKGKFEEIQEAFAAVFIALGAPPKAAMFCDEPTTPQPAFYFSPLAARLFPTILKTRGAVHCSAPKKGSVTLLVGEGDPSALLD